MKLTRLFQILVIASLVLALGAVPSQRVSAEAKIQPMLEQMAVEQPAARVRVIVQQFAGASGAEDQVAALGGQVVRDLRIINAFVAELPAEAAVELARSESVRWVSLDAPVQSSTLTNPTFTSWAIKLGTVIPNGFTNASNILGAAGPNQTFGSGSRVKGAFAGFQAEYNPDYMIKKVEAVLRLYPNVQLGKSESLKVTPYIGGQPGTTKVVGYQTLNAQNTTSTRIYLDITSSWNWKWQNFSNGIELVIDGTTLATNHTIYYDAVGLRITTESGSDSTTSLTMTTSSDTAAISATNITNVFPKVVRATDAWNTAPYYQGSGVTVAVIDSGNFKTNGLGTRLIGEVNFNSGEHTSNDQYGHGSHVTGIIADDGSSSGGQYMGVAPKVNVLGLRVADDYGMCYESDVVAAMQWVYENKTAYNIKVVNLSLNSSVYQSYHTSPLDAAAEILWFNSIVVVVSAGNNGTATLFPPANDPFVITVGATDDNNTVSLTDDVVTTFSAYGLDELGRPKPDIVAPGRYIIAYMPDTSNLTIPKEHPEGVVSSTYFRMSGTSMSAPVVSGGIALLMQKAQETGVNLTPDQVKYRLMATANKNWTGYDRAKAGAGMLDVYAALMGTSTQSANTGLPVSTLLTTGSDPVTWGSAGWNSAGWNSAGWNSVNWTSAGWNSAGWNSDYWGP